jgi:hypothetical protein
MSSNGAWFFVPIVAKVLNDSYVAPTRLASFIKLVIAVPYYFLLVVLPVIFAIALWQALTPGHRGSAQIEIPVRFQLDPTNTWFGA